MTHEEILHPGALKLERYWRIAAARSWCSPVSSSGDLWFLFWKEAATTPEESALSLTDRPSHFISWCSKTHIQSLSPVPSLMFSPQSAPRCPGKLQKRPHHRPWTVTVPPVHSALPQMKWSRTETGEGLPTASVGRPRNEAWGQSARSKKNKKTKKGGDNLNLKYGNCTLVLSQQPLSAGNCHLLWDQEQARAGERAPSSGPQPPLQAQPCGPAQPPRLGQGPGEGSG